MQPIKNLIRDKVNHQVNCLVYDQVYHYIWCQVIDKLWNQIENQKSSRRSN